jgi:hypothetical protein
MINGLLPDWRVHAQGPKEDVFASLKPPLWQWQAAACGPRDGLNFA